MNNNKPRIFGKPYFEEEVWRNFKDHQTVFETINANLEPIKSINGQDPFDFITNIGKDYLSLKSPQGTFVYNYFNLNNHINFYTLPLSIEDLSEFKVVYDNGQNFTIDYIVLYENKNNQMRENLGNMFPSNELKGENNLKESGPSFLNNILFKNGNKNVKLNKESIISNDNTSLKGEDFKWDYNHNNIYKCRVDDTNQNNVNYISSFALRMN